MSLCVDHLLLDSFLLHVDVHRIKRSCKNLELKFLFRPKDHESGNQSTHFIINCIRLH